MYLLDEPVKPFLKWVGSKTKLVTKISQRFPEGYDRLVEPFVGSGAVFLANNFSSYLLSDVNADLISLYRLMQTYPDELLSVTERMFEANTPRHHHSIEEATLIYNAVRTSFNDIKRNFEKVSSLWLSWEYGDIPVLETWQKHVLITRASTFLYLNRHAYGGMIRYNSSGGYNVPWGKYREVKAPLKDMRVFINLVSNPNFQFFFMGFEQTMSKTQLGDIVYCDPPYVQASTTASFSGYAKEGFTMLDHNRLLDSVLACASRGIPVLLSNHDTPETRELYRGADIEELLVKRFISAKAKTREDAREILAYWPANFKLD